MSSIYPSARQNGCTSRDLAMQEYRELHRPLSKDVPSSSTTAIPEISLDPVVFYFRQRHGKLDWKKLARVNVDQVVRDVDITVLQDLLDEVAFSEVLANDLPPTGADDLSAKLIRLSQLIIEYLLHAQERQGCFVRSLSQRLEAANKKKENAQMELQSAVREVRRLKRESVQDRSVLETCQGLLRRYGIDPAELWSFTRRPLRAVSSGTNTQHKRAACTSLDTPLTDYAWREHAIKGTSDCDARKDAAPSGEEKIAAAAAAAAAPAVEAAGIFTTELPAVSGTAALVEASRAAVRVCQVCGKAFSSEHFLNNHVARRHPRLTGAGAAGDGDDGEGCDAATAIDSTAERKTESQVFGARNVGHKAKEANALKNSEQSEESNQGSSGDRGGKVDVEHEQVIEGARRLGELVRAREHAKLRSEMDALRKEIEDLKRREPLTTVTGELPQQRSPPPLPSPPPPIKGNGADRRRRWVRGAIGIRRMVRGFHARQKARALAVWRAACTALPRERGAPVDASDPSGNHATIQTPEGVTADSSSTQAEGSTSASAIPGVRLEDLLAAAHRRADLAAQAAASIGERGGEQSDISDLRVDRSSVRKLSSATEWRTPINIDRDETAAAAALRTSIVEDLRERARRFGVDIDRTGLGEEQYWAAMHDVLERRARAVQSSPALSEAYSLVAKEVQRAESRNTQPRLASPTMAAAATAAAAAAAAIAPNVTRASNAVRQSSISRSFPAGGGLSRGGSPSADSGLTVCASNGAYGRAISGLSATFESSNVLASAHRDMPESHRACVARILSSPSRERGAYGIAGQHGPGGTHPPLRASACMNSKELLAKAKKTAEINREAFERRRSASDAAKRGDRPPIAMDAKDPAGGFAGVTAPGERHVPPATATFTAVGVSPASLASSGSAISARLSATATCARQVVRSAQETGSSGFDEKSTIVLNSGEGVGRAPGGEIRAGVTTAASASTDIRNVKSERSGPLPRHLVTRACSAGSATPLGVSGARKNEKVEPTARVPSSVEPLSWGHRNGDATPGGGGDGGGGGEVEDVADGSQPDGSKEVAADDNLQDDAAGTTHQERLTSTRAVGRQENGEEARDETEREWSAHSSAAPRTSLALDRAAVNLVRVADGAERRRFCNARSRGDAADGGPVEGVDTTLYVRSSTMASELSGACLDEQRASGAGGNRNKTARTSAPGSTSAGPNFSENTNVFRASGSASSASSEAGKIDGGALSRAGGADEASSPEQGGSSVRDSGGPAGRASPVGEDQVPRARFSSGFSDDLFSDEEEGDNISTYGLDDPPTALPGSAFTAGMDAIARGGKRLEAERAQQVAGISATQEITTAVTAFSVEIALPKTNSFSSSSEGNVLPDRRAKAVAAADHAVDAQAQRRAAPGPAEPSGTTVGQHEQPEQAVVNLIGASDAARVTCALSSETVFKEVGVKEAPGEPPAPTTLLATEAAERSHAASTTNAQRLQAGKREGEEEDSRAQEGDQEVSMIRDFNDWDDETDDNFARSARGARSRGDSSVDSPSSAQGAWGAPVEVLAGRSKSGEEVEVKTRHQGTELGVAT